MKNVSDNEGYPEVPNSQETAVAREEITFESALREAGIDGAFVARKLMDLAQAKEWRWNPKKGSWEKFEDYRTQLAAVREIAKIYDAYGKDSEDADVPFRIDISAIPIRREPVPRNG